MANRVRSFCCCLLPDLTPTICTSLSDAWNLMNPPPVGILDQLNVPNEPSIKLTASIYLPQQSRLVVGRQDGSIIIVPATQTVMLQLLHAQRLDSSGKTGVYELVYEIQIVLFSVHRMATASSAVWTPRKSQLLVVSVIGASKVSFPADLSSHDSPLLTLALLRYDKSHLLSGGVDFAVCLWDLYSGALLHRFCVHAGEITQLLVPPNSCSVSKSTISPEKPKLTAIWFLSPIATCSKKYLLCCIGPFRHIAEFDRTKMHLFGQSVSGTGKMISIGSYRNAQIVIHFGFCRHLFPVVSIKWRPLDDFLIVGCSDGTVYVWQMETGHLDRVLHGKNAHSITSFSARK